MGQKCLNLHLMTFIIILHFIIVFLAKSYPLAPAVYVFGDSLLDNGNNNLLPTLARADYAPYGVNFPSAPLGRFTNGRTFADLLAEYLGLEHPPAYASQRSPYHAFAGYNYASGAGGILPETGSRFGKCNSFGEQIEKFHETIELQLSPIFNNDQSQLSKHLSKSIFVSFIGVNDYLNNYIDPLYLSNKLYNPLQFAELLINSLYKHLERLYDLGVRKLILSEVPPLGCIPTVVRRAKLGPQVKGICDDEVNGNLLLFNERLPSMIQNFTSKHDGSHFIIVNVYNLVYKIISNPAIYGFDDTINPCCTTWVNGTLLCIPDVPPCSKPNKYFYFDGYHPTEYFYSILLSESVYGSSVCSPINIKQLVEIYIN